MSTGQFKESGEQRRSQEFNLRGRWRVMMDQMEIFDLLITFFFFFLGQ